MEEGASNVEGGEKSIPHEVVFDILTRLPVKSLIRFRSVSTLWNSTISDPSFSLYHLSLSLTRPPNGVTNLLLTFPSGLGAERLIYSAKIPANQTQSEPATYHLTLPGIANPYVSQSMQGLICLYLGSLRVCNPTTRKFITLPSTEAPPSSPSFTYDRADSFGFDPVRNVHKVLRTWVIYTNSTDLENEMIVEHRVFTVGSRQWRPIHDGPPYFPSRESVCINGFIYYSSRLGHWDYTVLVAFDVGVEDFHLIGMPDDTIEPWLWVDSALMEYEGHLAIVDYQGLRYGNNNLVIWKLEDEQKQKWVKKSVIIPSNCKIDWAFNFAGTTFSGEMIFAPSTLAKPFYVVFYDIKSNTLRRVEICGLPEHLITFYNITVTEYVECILSLAEP